MDSEHEHAIGDANENSLCVSSSSSVSWLNTQGTVRTIFKGTPYGQK